MNLSALAKVATPIAVLAAGVLIAGVMYIRGEPSSQPMKNPNTNPSVAVEISKINTTNEPTIGDPNAPIAMAYWSDYQCPFCSRFDTTELPQIIQNYVDTGKIRIVFKDFQFIGSDSDMDALYARAVWHMYPDKFGAWHQAMYASQPQENILNADANLAHIRSVTQSIPGMDFAMLTNDTNANKTVYEARISADRSEGSDLGINSTPSFVIGRQLISGAEAYADMAKAIDVALISR
ncbi:MAG: thioredoxin domain protein [Parcubacteria group bacterium]|nr:thioredoxin domain protein [Parcubacteria group bacterium]